ncbi:MAG: endonuclease domain-containing protein [Ignavibacterium sp.]|nr:MAG: endonuclease domain-containing protein [Ignavibacterium sp.]
MREKVYHYEKPNTLPRRLRRQSTEAERLLWKHLRGREFFNFKFRRQEQIGDYIVDFVFYGKKFIVELDGGHHNNDLTKKKDIIRQNWLENEGFTVIRFWYSEVLGNIDGVFQTIKEKLFPSP